MLQLPFQIQPHVSSLSQSACFNFPSYPTPRIITETQLGNLHASTSQAHQSWPADSALPVFYPFVQLHTHFKITELIERISSSGNYVHNGMSSSYSIYRGWIFLLEGYICTYIGLHTYQEYTVAYTQRIHVCTVTNLDHCVNMHVYNGR